VLFIFCIARIVLSLDKSNLSVVNEISTCSYGPCDVHVGFPIFGRWPTLTSLATVTELLQVSSCYRIAVKGHKIETMCLKRRPPYWNTHGFTRTFLRTEFDQEGYTSKLLT
jgi:hypothetical protein